LFDEKKTRGRKSRDTVPFKRVPAQASKILFDFPE
jgi:hypothetical protein